jgi:glycosyltransferase AglD
MMLTVIIPAHNAAKVLEKSFSLIKHDIETFAKNYEIIIAEDGSKDGTEKIAAKIAKLDGKVRHLHHKERLGRGRALNKAFSSARGDFIVYIDSDLDISPKYIKDLVEWYNKGFEVVVGSKRHPSAKTNSPFHRTILSRGYNFLVRLILKSKLYDHQTGLKGISKKAVMKVLNEVRDNMWFWDTELLVLLQWLGYKIKEVPLSIDYGFEGTTVRSMKATVDMFKGILKLRMRKRKFFKRFVK